MGAIRGMREGGGCLLNINSICIIYSVVILCSAVVLGAVANSVGCLSQTCNSVPMAKDTNFPLKGNLRESGLTPV